jgi:hypothetical protein
MNNSVYECPHCHRSIEASPVRGGGAGWRPQYAERTMNRINFGGGSSKAVKEATRRIPLSSARPSFESSFKTPFYISLATGFFVAIGGLLLSIEFRYAAGASLVAAFITWAWQVKGDRSLLSYVEVLTNQDLNQDGNIGEPTQEPQKNLRVTVTEKQKGAKSWTGYFDSPIEPSVLGQFARAILAGRPAGERNWTGQGQPFSLNEYIDFRDELIERGLFCWKNKKAHQQGFKLTARGRAVFKELAAIPATTPPELLG